MKDARLLKQFQSQLSAIENDIIALKSELSIKNREMTQKETIRKELKRKIENFGRFDDIIVSEHAILRYLERIGGLNIDEIQAKILSKSVMELINSLDANDGQYPVKEEGFSIKLKNKVVVTIV